MRSSHPDGASAIAESLRSASERAEACERAGDWEGAAKIYAAAFGESLAARDVAGLVECLRKGARALHRSGGSEEATELALLSHEIADRNELPAAAARSLNLLALFAHSVGRLDEAREIYTTALEKARGANDEELIGAVCQNLGVLANIRGDLREARALYFECIGTVVRTGNRAAAMVVYNNLGMVCGDLREWLEAEIYFGRGIEIATQAGDTPMLAKLLVNRAEPLIEFGELEQALELLARGKELAENLEDDCLRADIARFRSRIHRIREEYDAAEKQVELALRISREAGLRLEEAEAHEESAYLRWAEQRPGPARMLLREALRTYVEIGAREDAARVNRVSASWAVDGAAAAIAASDEALSLSP